MDQQHKELKEEVGRGANKVSGQMELSAQPSSLKLFGAGFVLSGCSPSFYYYAARRHVITAVLWPAIGRCGDGASRLQDAASPEYG